MISTRISNLSSSEEIFNQEIDYYRDALTSAGYKDLQLEYTKPKAPRRQRRRKVTWFNPPFNCEVTTNVEDYFLKLVDKFLTKNRHPKIAKAFNRATLKVSYSTTHSMKAHLDKHNKKILQARSVASDKCNCQERVKKDCPLPGKCAINEVVYQADVTEEGNGRKMTYYGLTENTFKKGHGGHKWPQALLQDREKQK